MEKKLLKQCFRNIKKAGWNSEQVENYVFNTLKIFNMLDNTIVSVNPNKRFFALYNGNMERIVLFHY